MSSENVIELPPGLQHCCSVCSIVIEKEIRGKYEEKSTGPSTERCEPACLGVKSSGPKTSEGWFENTTRTNKQDLTTRSIRELDTK